MMAKVKPWPETVGACDVSATKFITHISDTRLLSKSKAVKKKFLFGSPKKLLIHFFLQLLIANHVSKGYKNFRQSKNFLHGAAARIRALSISANVLGDLGFILKRIKVINCNLKKGKDIYKESVIEFLLQKQKS